MNVYFENSKRKIQFLGNVKNNKMAWELIYAFLNEHKYKPYYVREWDDENGKHWYDVGSHTEFFYTEESEK